MTEQFGPWKLIDVWRSSLEGECSACEEPIRPGQIVLIDPEAETVGHRHHYEKVVVSTDNIEQEGS